MHKGLLKIALAPLAALFLGACGLLVGTPFIEPVPQADITQTLNNHAVVDLRNYTPHPDAFSHFVIFYRIYISAHSEMNTSPGNFNVINTLLHQNYNRVHPFIDNDDFVGQNMHALFSEPAMRFRYLALAEHDINQVLGQGGGGQPAFFTRPVDDQRLYFDFVSGQPPSMRIGGIGGDTFTLYRATQHFNPLLFFTPEPGRHFFNSEDLRDADNLNDERNADVAGPAGDAVIRIFTYAAMFIVAVGTDPLTFADIFSTPALTHVFMLPDEPP
ncbi:MAG: hypothetical protein FWC65_04620 [Treponema sp.]|nr:hypothetical protein [Treponema sp.]